MSFWRHQILKTTVGFLLFVISILPTFYLIGGLASVMPATSASVAFWLVGIIWLLGMVIGTHLITEKLSKRWNG